MYKKIFSFLFLLLILFLFASPIFAKENALQKAGKYKLVLEFGKYGSGEGEFDIPIDIAVDNKGAIYVVDMKNNFIQKFDSLGKFIKRIDISALNPLNQDIKIKFKGRYSTDRDGTVRISSKESEFKLISFGSIFSIDIDGSENYYMSIGTNFKDIIMPASAIFKFNNDFEYLGYLNGIGLWWGYTVLPLGVSFDELGDIYIGDKQKGKVIKYNKNGNYLFEIGHTFGYPELPQNSMQIIESIADQRGNTYALSNEKNIFYLNKFDKDGALIKKTDKYKYFQAMEIDKNSGNIIAKMDDVIIFIDSDLKLISRWKIKNEKNNLVREKDAVPPRFTTDSDGNLYFIDQKTCKVLKYAKIQ